MRDNLSQNDLDEITPERFDHWLRSAPPGSKLQYHYGLLASDRETVRLLPPPWSTYAHIYFEPMHSVGIAAYRAYEQGKVDLVQQKVGPETYRYFAIKRRNRRQK